jgi:fructokinase
VKESISIICFGEVLFDIFPTHTKIGGAPLNVAFRLSTLGISTQIISRIGNDILGKQVLAFVENNNIGTSAIQIDNTLSTGQVAVVLNDKGSATYTINYPVAWDKIESNSNIEQATKNAIALVFGSLACRDAVSYQTLKTLLQFAMYKIFDINLRTPFYSKELLLDLMNISDFIKFNDDELSIIANYLNSPYQSIEQNIQFVAQATSTKHICVTKGSEGAVLYYDGLFYYNAGYTIQVADTVGAGDSFLAGLISKLLTQSDPQKALNFACALGALVATKEGANPDIDEAQIMALVSN